MRVKSLGTIFKDVYGVRIALGGATLLSKSRGADIRPCEKPWITTYATFIRRYKLHELLPRAVIRRRTCHGAERIFSGVTERTGADIRLRGKSRISTEQISAATNVTNYCGPGTCPSHGFFHVPIYPTPSSKPHKPRHFPTVHRSNYVLK